MNLFERTVQVLGRFRRAKKGSAAVEFAMLAIPFFLLLYAVIDTSLVYFATSTLENGVATAAQRLFLLVDVPRIIGEELSHG